jgi:[acyl-carrier-protein] S-malonyltransferase
MAEAAAATRSGMAAVMGAEPAELEGICSERRDDGGSLWVANLNAPGQTVVAGADDDLEWLASQASELGLRRVIPLEVAGAFHTPLMESAVAPLADALSEVTFVEGEFGVWSNVDAMPHGDLGSGAVADKLLAQLTSPVRFADSLSAIAGTEVTAFIHFGPGNVTAGMARRTVADAVTAAVADAAGASTAANDLSVD